MSAILANLTLPGLLHNMANPSSQALGALGEQLAYLLLEQSGYTVSNAHPKEHRGDLRVVTPDGQILRVEIKTARRTTDGKWRFMLCKRGHNDHRHSDIVILLCATRASHVVPFVVPTSVLERQNAAVISSDPHTYAGKLSPYRQKMHKLSLEVNS